MECSDINSRELDERELNELVEKAGAEWRCTYDILADEDPWRWIQCDICGMDLNEDDYDPIIWIIETEQAVCPHCLQKYVKGELK